MQGITSQDTTGPHGVPQSPPSDFSDAVFARQLKAVRLAAGLTQQELAERMASTGNKIHRSTIGKIESGDRPVTIGEAVQFAGILGVPLAELITDPASGEHAYRALVDAQIAVRSLQHEAAERYKQLEEAQILYDNTVVMLKAAQQRLAELRFERADRIAELGGEVSWAAGKDDQ